MRNKKSCFLFAAFLVFTAVVPLMAGSSTPVISNSSSSIAMTTPSVATIEALVSNVDAWGGVTNIIGTIQNGTHYGYSHIQDLEDVITGQMSSDNGYVSMAVLSMQGLTPFPNGAIGPPSIVVELSIQPILQVPSDENNAAFLGLSTSSAVEIAEEVIAVYESALGVNLERFSVVKSEGEQYFHYGSNPGTYLDYVSYEITYLALLTKTEGETTMDTFRDRLASLGGFMDLVGADEWPNLLTAATEAYLPFHYTNDEEYFSSFVGNMLSRYRNFYYRADASHTDLQETVQSAVISQASFNYPGAVEPVSGDETYSLLDDIGFTENLQNKMEQDTSAESISAILGVAPAHLTMTGIPENWTTIDDAFEIPTEIYLPTGHVLPANTSIAEYIQAYLSYLPRDFGLQVNEMLGTVNTTFLEGIIDNLWATSGPFIDFKDFVKNYPFDELDDAPLISLNTDLLQSFMEAAGLNAEALIAEIDESVLEDSPLKAIVKAFIAYFDSYSLLDILDNDVYADPVEVEGYINTLMTGVGAFLKDFAGVDVPAEFKDKEALATFVQTHWGVLLQALWDAMAGGDLESIRTAFHNLADSTELQERIAPFFMMDLGASFVAGIGFLGAINLDFISYEIVGMDTDDLTMSFDADPEAISFDGPYLVVTKAPDTREITQGGTLSYTITVHNYGDATAHHVRVLDGMSSGLDGEREWLWSRDTLTSGETWTIPYSVSASDAGLYMDLPALCAYFNTSIDTYNPANPEAWTGSALYTMSAPGYQVLINPSAGGLEWLEGETLGIPNLYLAVGAGGIAVIGIAILLVRRRS